jgi:hypothetical protein
MSKDARFSHSFRIFVTITLLVFARIAVGQALPYETENFIIVNAPDALTAKQFGDAAEQYRHDLSLLWLGKTLPNWSSKCPVRVQVGANLGAGGATTFVFDRGEVYDWDMDIQGSKEQILDSVLPHEITHTVFATHFRSPIPRWLDEGAATSVEHINEKKQYQQLLKTFLRSDSLQCLPFNKLVALKEYPDNPMPFYAQGHSVTEYLLQLGEQFGAQTETHRRLVQFIETVMATGDWHSALQKHYRVATLGNLQTDWIAWLAAGSRAATQSEIATTVLGNYGRSVYER